MNRTFLISLLLVLCFQLTAQSDDLRWQGVEEELNEILATWQAPGFAVAVVEKDKVVYARGFGYADYEAKRKADANTLFAIKGFDGFKVEFMLKEGATEEVVFYQPNGTFKAKRKQ